MKMLLARVIATLFLAVFLSCGVPALAQEYPARVVKIVVPFPAGSATDIMARLLADQLSRSWGKPVIVENGSGAASGNISAADVARAAPDGYTLMLSPPGPLSTNSLLYKNLSYDPQKWVVISHLLTIPNVLVVRKDLDVSTVGDFISKAKSDSKRLTWASAGPATSQALTVNKLEAMAGVQLVAIPYRGLAAGMKDLIAGQVDAMVDSLTTSLPLHEASTVKIIGVGSEKRIKSLPNIATIAEAGLPGFKSLSWWGVVAPPGTPENIADKLNADITVIMRSSEIQSKLSNMHGEVVASNRRDAALFFADETNYWGKIVKEANVSMD